MIELFTRKKHKLNYPISQPYTLEYVKKMYFKEMTRIVNYYYENTIYIKSDHILVRTMENILPDIELDIDTFYFYVLNDSRRVANNMGFSTVSNKGNIFKNIFFKDSKEVFLNSDYIIDGTELEKYDNEYNYYGFNYIPCRTLYTRDTDLGLPLPDGSKKIDSLHNISVYEINLVCLCLEYRCWARTMMQLNEDYNIKRYIGKIVLPKMIYNHLNLAILNRYLYNVNTTNKIDKNHPFVISDFTGLMTKIINSIKKYNDDVKKPVISFIDNIPCIFNKKMLDAMYINNKIYTRSNSWVLWLARLPYIVAIIKNLGINGIIYNKKELNTLPLYVHEMKNRSIQLLEILPSGFKEEYTEYMDYINYINETLFKR